MSKIRATKIPLFLAILLGLTVALSNVGFPLSAKRVAAQTADSTVFYLTGLAQAEDGQVKINLINLAAIPTEVSVTAYNELGVALGAIDAATQLDAGQTIAIESWNLPRGTASVRVESAGRIAGNVVFSTAEGDRGEVIPALDAVATQLDFPALARTVLARQTITLLNPQAEPVGVELIAFDSNGAEMGRQSVPPLAAMESRSFAVAEVLAAATSSRAQDRGLKPRVALVRAVSARELAGLQMAQSPRGDLLGLPALVGGGQAWRFYVPQSSDEGALVSVLRLFNPEEAAAHLTIEAYDAKETLLGVVEQLDLAPHASRSFDLAQLRTALPPETTSLKVTTEQAVNGCQVLAVAGGRGQAALTGTAEGDESIVAHSMVNTAAGRALEAYPIFKLDDDSVAFGHAHTAQEAELGLLSLQGEQVLGARQLNAAAAATTYAIAGRVTNSSGQGVAGVRITFSKAGAGSLPAAVTTNAQGRWSQAGFSTNAAYYGVTPSKAGLSFSPTLAVVNRANTNVNFTTLTTYSVSGRVRAANGTGISLGITIVFTSLGSAPVPASVRPRQDGTFSQSGFVSGTNYWVQVRDAAGISYLPSYIQFNGARTDLNFTRPF